MQRALIHAYNTHAHKLQWCRCHTVPSSADGTPWHQRQGLTAWCSPNRQAICCS